MRNPAKTFLILFPILVILTACAAQSKEKTLKTTFITVNAVRDGFLEWDRRQQEDIVAKAATFEDGRRDLMTYVEQRSPVTNAFNAAYHAIALAALDPKAENIDLAVIRAEELLEDVKKLTGKDFK